jgi:hypothetical protein
MFIKVHFSKNAFRGSYLLTYLLKPISFSLLCLIVNSQLFSQIVLNPINISPNIPCVNPFFPTWVLGENKITTSGSANCDMRIGIGTSNPQENLHVFGNTLITGLTKTKKLAVGSEPYFPGVISATYLGTNQSNYPLLNIGTYYPPTQTQTPIFVVKPNGDLRLSNGTNDIFYVNGANETAYAREIIVDGAIWPDYVFEEKYKLLPLNEVREFIKNNGHLPNVPNAETVSKEGVRLGDMNRVLLEKVEELTLYLLEQDEKIKLQEERIEKLEEILLNK